VATTILAMERLFTDLFTKNQLPLKTQQQDKYKRTFAMLLDCFDHTAHIEGQQALVTCMKLMALEAGNETFPLNRYRLVLDKLLSPSQRNTHLFESLAEFGSHLDVVHHTWVLLPNLLSKTSPNTVALHNALELINVVPVSSEIAEDDATFLCAGSKFSDFDYEKVRKSINKVWLTISMWQHTEDTQTQTLVLLLERVLPHLEKPELLTDYMMDSLDVDGPVCLLALQGIFVLIQQYNLTYPNIYEKIYSMFNASIFHTKYKARLFVLADIFLSSSHLPEKLVAAFVKRLGRLALIAPANDAVVICQFVGNLILRHPGLKCLIDSQRVDSVDEDPYNPDERDPYKANALNSFLWEIQALQSDVSPAVATAAKFMARPLPKMEWDMQAALEAKESDVSIKIFDSQQVFGTKFPFLQLFHKEITKNTKGMAMSLQAAEEYRSSEIMDRVFNQFWQFK
jgi:U3 small nucleolar RNA-associated protein 19